MPCSTKIKALAKIADPRDMHLPLNSCTCVQLEPHLLKSPEWYSLEDLGRACVRPGQNVCRGSETYCLKISSSNQFFRFSISQTLKILMNAGQSRQTCRKNWRSTECCPHAECSRLSCYRIVPCRIVHGLLRLQ